MTSKNRRSTSFSVEEIEFMSQLNRALVNRRDTNVLVSRDEFRAIYQKFARMKESFEEKDTGKAARQPPSKVIPFPRQHGSEGYHYLAWKDADDG
tara:strand:- start:175 stop:459 length:285 start_codon:yes stop_codon:yes gene_type:complete